MAPIGISYASTDLVSGDDAVIVDAHGDTVRLRSKPGLDGAVVAEFAEGTAVRVLDGPRISDDGEAWYRVHVAGQTGYMAAVFLDYPGAPEPDPVEEPAVTPEPDTEAPAAPDTEIIGTATIVNSNGDPIRCRAAGNADAEILAQLIDGMTVQLAGQPVDGWQPVICEGLNGWIHTDFLSTSAGETPVVDEEAEESDPEPMVQEASVTGSGKIAGTNGDGVRCRSKASTSGTVITTLAEGTTVDLRGAKKGDWQPVYCAGRSGYVWAEYVSISKSGGGSNSGGGNTATGAGVIYNTDGQALRCRKKATYEGQVLTVLVEGDEVQFRGYNKGVWTAVYCDGKRGYVHQDFVKAGTGNGNGGGNTGGNNGGSSGGGSTSGFESGDNVKVDGTGGQGVRFRSSANSSASVISVLSEGTSAKVRSGSTGDWVAITYRGSDGFVHKDYLVESSSGGSSGGGNTGGSGGGGLTTGDHARVTSSLNFRSGANTSADVLMAANEGIVVKITGTKQNGFYPVNWGGIDGFMHGDYLEETDEDLTPGAGSDGGGVSGDAGNGAPSAVGREMVDYAMNYIGFPYIWATAGPNSFDCSGFTYWVTKHVLGQDIGRGLWTQVVAGTPVSYGNLKPGDIVFFQNTYTWGLSHVGIYIGNNQFVHAENEDTGVRISSITSNYYSTRYYGAVRLG
jgi:uncharacterized protein YgiM (DUF1202 family)